MTRAEVTTAITEILQKCRGTTTVLIALIADEDDDTVRVMHPLQSDKMCANLLTELAKKLSIGDT